MKNAIILASGGLDSTVTAYHVRNEFNYNNIKFLFFNYGQRPLTEEEFCSRSVAKKIGAEFIKVNINWLGRLSTSFINRSENIPKTTEKDLEHGTKNIINWWVPCRNSVFLISALAFAESEFLKNKMRFDVFIGLKNEGTAHMKDTTPEFLEDINNLADNATHHGGYKVLAPLITMDKTEVISLGEKLEVPFHLTYSCYIENGSKNGKVIHCGLCLNCMLRKKGFYWAGVEDPTSYRAL